MMMHHNVQSKLHKIETMYQLRRI